MRGSRKFCQGGGGSPTFIYDEGKEDPNSTESGPSSATSETPFVVLLRDPMFFVIFQRGVPTPCPPSGSAHGLHEENLDTILYRY